MNFVVKAHEFAEWPLWNGISIRQRSREFANSRGFAELHALPAARLFAANA
jgi:hypothetical protein